MRPIPIQLPTVDTPGPTALRRVAEDISGQFVLEGHNRFPSSATFVPRHGVALFATDRLVEGIDCAAILEGTTLEPEQVAGAGNQASEVEQNVFMYADAINCSNIGSNEIARTEELVRSAVARQWPVAQSYAAMSLLIANATAVPEANVTAGVDTDALPPKQAVAALESSLLEIGIHDIVIHLPAIYYPEVAGSFREVDESYITPLGSRLHIVPTPFAQRAGTANGILNAQGDPLIYASSGIYYAETEMEIHTGEIAQTPATPVGGMERNAHMVYGVRYGGIFTDPFAVRVVRSADIDSYQITVP